MSAILRERLGIPESAERVIIFAESSHWDPNWLFTSEQYYRLRIRRILDDVVRVLKEEPRRVFSIESTFFLEKYFERADEARQEELRQLMNSGRLRLSGCAVTTPDTLLPEAECIIRDYLYGQEWLRAHGVLAEPRVAYLPDNFGHSPLLPSILNALGCDRAAVSRIDGMYFAGTDYRSRGSFPLKGSTAEDLLHQHQSTDFVWRSPDGSELLCHWNAFTYFQGDMLAHLGIIRWMGIPFGVPYRSERHIARRIGAFVRQLEPLAKTPYLLCPIGCDFNGPIPRLVDLLDRYNEHRFETTGVWAVSASLEDYLDLVDEHRAELPVLDIDPNPYWMGFYSSRPSLKSTCRRVNAKAILAEKMFALGDREPSAECPQMRETWQLLVLSNHHDFITGTAPDSVFESEQEPWLARAESVVDERVARVRVGFGPALVKKESRPPIWRMIGTRLEIETPYYLIEIDGEAGGCITRFRDAKRGEILTGPSNDLVVHHDTGGLWRMGHEYLGGEYREIRRSSLLPAQIRTSTIGGRLRVEVSSVLFDKPFIRRLSFSSDCPIVEMQTFGAARARTTVTCRFNTRLSPSCFEMDVPGGIVRRPLEKLHTPTFWAARSFVHSSDHTEDFGLTAFLAGPAASSLRSSGTLEWIVARNAPFERAFGLLPIPAHPVFGTSPEPHRFDYGVRVSGARLTPDIPALAERFLARAHGAGFLDLYDEIDARAHTDSPEVRVVAIKPASRGSGVIVRLHNHSGAPRSVALRFTPRLITSAHLCDARERDLEPLAFEGRDIRVLVERAFASVRLVA